jgi:hypothetical protein
MPLMKFKNLWTALEEKPVIESSAKKSLFSYNKIY